jgi:serine/threonine-protein kinase RsbW
MSFFGEKIFPANLDSLKEFRDYIVIAAAGTALTKKKLYKLQLAVDEIATNIISYGYQEDKNTKGEILINAEIQEKSLLIILKDFGMAFDPREKFKQGEDSCNLSVEERRIGGLGIYLAITSVDNFAYEYRDGFNINRFEIYP